MPDRDRPLAKRGRRDAPRVGRWLHEHGYQPDVVVCSAARRTRQTWDLVAPELGGSPAVRFEPRAYAASALTLLYLAQELPSRYRTALLIAHNPGLSELAGSLTAPARPRTAPDPASASLPPPSPSWSSPGTGPPSPPPTPVSSASSPPPTSERGLNGSGTLPGRGEYANSGNLRPGRRLTIEATVNLVTGSPGGSACSSPVRPRRERLFITGAAVGGSAWPSPGRPPPAPGPRRPRAAAGCGPRRIPGRRSTHPASPASRQAERPLRLPRKIRPLRKIRATG